MTDEDLELIAEAMAELTVGRSTKAHDKIVEGFALLLNTVVRLDARVASLEATRTKYKGVWQPALRYAQGDYCTFDGSIFHCNADTRAKPANGSTDWTLAVKRGADGKDAERRHVPTTVRK